MHMIVSCDRKWFWCCTSKLLRVISTLVLGLLENENDVHASVVITIQLYINGTFN